MLAQVLGDLEVSDKRNSLDNALLSTLRIKSAV